MNFNEANILSLFNKSLQTAKSLLASVEVAEGREPTANLSGWIFEQTIRFCLSRELGERRLYPKMDDQVSLVGRARVDLLVGSVAVELKVRGSFGVSDKKYYGYGQTARGKGWHYLYLTLAERHAPYKSSTVACFGSDCAFFLDVEGEWERFVLTVVGKLLQSAV